jgi:hypothetical protein
VGSSHEDSGGPPELTFPPFCRYILCQAEAKGQLIVSEFTGVASQLNKAIKVNPWDLGVRALCVSLSRRPSPR